MQAALARGRPTVASMGAPAEVLAIRDWNPKALDALFGVVQDATADFKARRKAALKIAEFLLPKVGKKPKLIPDEYGFSISANLANAYRDIRLELQALQREPTRKIPAIAEKIEKLEARSDSILRRLQVPCPSKYGDKEAAEDDIRLMNFAALRENETVLTEERAAEEAHRLARYHVFRAGPEAVARRRREALEKADRRFRMYRLDREFYAPPLSRKERCDLKLLRWLYPAAPKPDLAELETDGLGMYGRYHPFEDELLAPDGNFYPRHSKLRPGGAAGCLSVKTPDVPSFVGKLQLEGHKARILGMLQLEEPKARIYELEKRRVGETLTPAEEQESQDLRQRHPRIAEVVSEMNLLYGFWFEEELKIATKAGLDIGAATLQTKIVCLRFEKDDCISKWDLQQLREDGTWSYNPAALAPAETATTPSTNPKLRK
jgi:hypothetical protein